MTFIHMFNGDKMNVRFDQDRQFWNCLPWIATCDGYEPGEYFGEGNSEKEAIEDLLQHGEDYEGFY